MKIQVKKKYFYSAGLWFVLIFGVRIQLIKIFSVTFKRCDSLALATLGGDNFSNTDSMIAKIHTDTIFFSADWESRGENVSVIRRKLQNLCKQTMMKMIASWSSLICGSEEAAVDESVSWSRIHYDLLLRHLAVTRKPSSIRASCLVSLFFSLINVDPTDVGDRDCRMLKKDYPSYACFQCQ